MAYKNIGIMKRVLPILERVVHGCLSRSSSREHYPVRVGRTMLFVNSFELNGISAPDQRRALVPAHMCLKSGHPYHSCLGRGSKRYSPAKCSSSSGTYGVRSSSSRLGSCFCPVLEVRLSSSTLGLVLKAMGWNTLLPSLVFSSFQLFLFPPNLSLLHIPDSDP